LVVVVVAFNSPAATAQLIHYVPLVVVVVLVVTLVANKGKMAVLGLE
jgi:hypothetical protein